MSGFFSRLFGGGDKAKVERRLRHPRDLLVGDIIKFSYLKQHDLSAQQFEVAQINTYVYGGLDYPELVLKDRSGNIVYLMVEEEDGEEYLALSKKVKKAQIREVISQEDLDAVMQRGTGTKVKVASQPEGLEQWLTKKYRETDDNVKGSFVKGDMRTLSAEEGRRQERFTSHTLVDKSDKYALEIEIYETGEIELSVTVYHDIDDIDEMWPAQVSDT
ncbi:MAG: hypothetical protein Q9N67_07175 [Ghiorsea sp.]|nr:hypothetical protein [Ghiorsea sp.]